MKYLNLTLALVLAIGLGGCKNSTSKSDNKGNQTQQSTEQLVADFPTPEIPIMLTNPEDRGAYLSGHFWDKLSPNDTAVFNNEELMEQKWVNYLDILARFQPEESPQHVEQLLLRFQDSPSAYATFNQLADKYLYEADSPFRNDLIYVAVLKVRLGDSSISETDKEHLSYKLEICSKNNVGSKAEDISFMTSNQKIERLENIKAEFTILFFNDLDCNLCANATQELKDSELITNLEQEGTLKIVTINIGDDFTAWKDKTATWPKRWVNGFDADMKIVNNNSFDLRAIPSFYLLDKDKKVMLKDKPLAEIMELLAML